MKPIYVTSIDTFSGKTAVCLALGKCLQEDGHIVGYLKPVSTQPWQVEGKIADEDANFVKTILGLEEEPWELAPVVITQDLLDCVLHDGCERDLVAEVRTACHKAEKDKDVLLVEGGASLREGYAINLPTTAVAEMLGTQALVVVKYRGPMHVLDDTLVAQHRLGDRFLGVIINSVPEDAWSFVTEVAVPHLESRGITVFGVLPHKDTLAAISVGELVEALGATVLVGESKTDEMVENLMVGAMTTEAALARFRRQQHKAVITGGDRTNIQLAALETSTVCLILTGNLQPSPLVLQLADDMGVAVLLVPDSTLETVEAIEKVFGKTRLGHAEKFNLFQELMKQHVSYGNLCRAIGL